MPVKTKEKKKPIWNLTQDNYVDLLKTIEINSKAIVTLQNEVNRLKGRMGLGAGI